MKKTIALMLAFLLVLSLGLSACGKPAANANEAKEPEPPVTVESLISGFGEKIKAGTGAVYDTELSLKISITVLGQAQSLDMTGKLNTKSKGDIAHTKGSITTIQNGEGGPAEMDTWTVKNGDSVITYTNTNGKWTKQETKTYGFIDSIQSLMVAKDYSSFALSETDSEYLVKGTINVGALIDMLGELLGDLGEFGDFSDADISKAAPAEAEYRFDKATKDLTYCALDFKECYQSIMDELIKALGESLSSQGSGEGSDSLNPFSGLDISAFLKIVTDEFSVKTTIIRLDPDLVLELPEEAKNAGEAESGSGTESDWLTEHRVEEMSISLPSDFQAIDVDGFTKAFYDGLDIVLILREEKSALGEYAKNMDEYLALVIKANEGRGITEASSENGHPLIEYDAESNGITYRYYTAVYESDKAFWLLQFACEASNYDAIRSLYVFFADTVEFHE